MMDLSSFTQWAIRVGAIQQFSPELAKTIKSCPPMADAKETGAPKFGEASQNNATDIMMSDMEVAFEERAAILEYDGGYPRVEAERLARVEIYGENA